MNLATIPHSVTALIFYALWAIALVIMVAADRVLMVLKGEQRLTAFSPGVPHGSDSYWRINRAHLNTVENLPVFAAIVVAGWIAGMETHLFNALAVIVVVARIVQSAIHIASGSAGAIQARFAMFGVQLICEVWMAILVLWAANVF